DAEQPERRALAPLDARTQHAVADEGNRQRRENHDRGNRRPCRGREPEVSLAEDLWPVLEEELKEGLQHGSCRGFYPRKTPRWEVRLCGPEGPALHGHGFVTDSVPLVGSRASQARRSSSLMGSAVSTLPNARTADPIAGATAIMDDSPAPADGRSRRSRR